jgi:hypothetical protein
MAATRPIVRDIRILGIAGIHRSTAAALRRQRRSRVERRPMQRELLSRLQGELVLLTTRDGDALIGRLRVTRDAIEIWQVVAQIPCRHRVALDDIAACCLHLAEEPFWDVPTAPL